MITGKDLEYSLVYMIEKVASVSIVHVLEERKDQRR